MRTSIRTRATCAAALTAASLMAFDADAETRRPLDQTFNLNVGAFLFGTDTGMRVDGTAGSRGTEINLDDEFGFDDQTRVRVDGYWRFAARHKVRFMYFGSRSESRREIAREISFRDTTFPASASVKAELDGDVFELAYEYSFFKRDSLEIAGTVGLHTISLSTSLSASVSGPSGTQVGELTEKAEGDGPLPVIGVRALWALSDHFYFDAQAQFFAIEIDNYDGSLHDYKISFVWQPLDNLGIGIGYNDFVTKLDVADDRFDGRLEFEYGGALAFLTVAF